ncbi:MAG: hypothetical protein O3B87_01450 [bacterium]|nr:hypothetical protein [bacterium]
MHFRFFTHATIVILLFTILISPSAVRADELEDINAKLSKLNTDLQGSQNATEINEQQLAGLNAQIASIKASVLAIEQGIIKKEAEIISGEERLVSQKAILDERIASLYKQQYKAKDALIELLVSDNFNTSLKHYSYQQNLLDDDKRTIVRVVLLVKDIEKKKLKLEDEKERLIPIKEQIDKQSSFLEGEVLSAKKYQQELKNEIVSLSARQQEILSQRLSSLNIPRSAGTSARGCSDDRGINPGFSSAIAFFTYGAPHRNGLNQYGALGRAKAGQSPEQILSEYYPGMSLNTGYDQNTPVNVDGHKTFTIEDYVKRIYEVPNSWGDQGGMAALKAQAVAARTYALNKMNRIGSICTTEACQVFKPEVKGGNWEQAVNDTAGWVLMDGGSPGFTEYASTHGGYILNISKFDGRDGNPGSFSELNDRAYDKESPWFYCDWGYRSEYANTAWLKSEEVADIVNTLMLVKRDSSTAENLYQLDKPNPAGKETWSPDKVKQELRNKGGSPLESVSSISVSADFGSGKSTTVTINGEGFSSGEFKDRFNLRAPANIQIVGPLFNVERK